jgi:hypothetical protein
MQGGALIGKPGHAACFGACHGPPPRVRDRRETGGGDPDGSAGGAGGSAPRGIGRRGGAGRRSAGRPRWGRL